MSRVFAVVRDMDIRLHSLQVCCAGVVNVSLSSLTLAHLLLL